MSIKRQRKITCKHAESHKKQLLLLNTAPGEPFPRTAGAAGMDRTPKAPTAISHTAPHGAQAESAHPHHISLRSSKQAFMQTKYNRPVLPHPDS